MYTIYVSADSIVYGMRSIYIDVSAIHFHIRTRIVNTFLYAQLYVQCMSVYGLVYGGFVRIHNCIQYTLLYMGGIPSAHACPCPLNKTRLSNKGEALKMGLRPSNPTQRRVHCKRHSGCKATNGLWQIHDAT